MSLFGKYLKGWQFRSANPSFEVGQELTAMITGTDGDTPVARVGDTILRVPDAPRTAVDKRVRLRVTEFDGNEHEGTAELVEVVGETTF
ncbi:DUF7513 family protein [Halorarum salinum]|uniref:DUF7513 domain-containing protein n=1 Tax=Halorarum salinum TaxID=2743089 RepID=A0A7D5L8A7_9EURY|nr:hypothetical protein [Halobaculum salinum]QLG60408.1 hypothetical protein HUG12_01025 [Halobaculum salinum]